MKKYGTSLAVRRMASWLLFIVIALFIMVPLYALFLATFKDGKDMIQYGLNLSLEWTGCI